MAFTVILASHACWWRRAHAWSSEVFTGPAGQGLLPVRAARLSVSGPPRRQGGQPEGGWTAQVVGGQVSGPGAGTGGGHWFLRLVGRAHHRGSR
jgi:hypothetical protein